MVDTTPEAQEQRNPTSYNDLTTVQTTLLNNNFIVWFCVLFFSDKRPGQRCRHLGWNH